jgi:hypothetical protein
MSCTESVTGPTTRRSRGSSPAMLTRAFLSRGHANDFNRRQMRQRQSPGPRSLIFDHFSCFSDNFDTSVAHFWPTGVISIHTPALTTLFSFIHIPTSAERKAPWHCSASSIMISQWLDIRTASSIMISQWLDIRTASSIMMSQWLDIRTASSII